MPIKTVKYFERRVKKNKWAKKIDESDTAHKLQKYRWFKKVWKYRWRVLVAYVIFKLFWYMGTAGFILALTTMK